MAQTLLNASSGDVLFTYDAPYSQYLRALSDEWDQAKCLEATLQEARKELDYLRAFSKRREPLASKDNLCFAAIVDICPRQRKRCRRCRTTGQSSDPGRAHRYHQPGCRRWFFLGSLRHCATNIHTRIIVLQHSSSRDSEDDRSIQALFNSHLLGFELGLAPAYVSYLSQDRRIQGLQRWWHMRTYPSLMFGQIGKTAKIALYLGRRSFGDGSPYTSECM
jgi:hypothetical protein